MGTFVVALEQVSRMLAYDSLSCSHFTLTVAALKYEPKNKLMLDYQETLAQYINNGEMYAREHDIDTAVRP